MFEKVAAFKCRAGSATVSMMVTFWSALPDTVEYGEMRNGHRDEAFTFGVMSFAQKASYGLGAALAGWLLDVIGYQANGSQSQAILDALKVCMTLLPAVLILTAFCIIGRYRLDQTVHGRILAIVEKRRVRVPSN